MGLTSAALVVFLALLAALLLIGAVTFWRRLARPGLRYVLGRILVICAFDVIVLGLILAIANQRGGFYASWSELFGTEHRSLPGSPGGAACWSGAHSWSLLA